MTVQSLPFPGAAVNTRRKNRETLEAAVRAGKFILVNLTLLDPPRVASYEDSPSRQWKREHEGKYFQVSVGSAQDYLKLCGKLERLANSEENIFDRVMVRYGREIRTHNQFTLRDVEEVKNICRAAKKTVGDKSEYYYSVMPYVLDFEADLGRKTPGNPEFQNFIPAVQEFNLARKDNGSVFSIRNSIVIGSTYESFFEEKSEEKNNMRQALLSGRHIIIAQPKIHSKTLEAERAKYSGQRADSSACVYGVSLTWVVGGENQIEKKARPVSVTEELSLDK